MNNQKDEKLNRWFVEPINALKNLPDGNGGMVLFIIGLVLYERLTRAKLKIIGKIKVTEEEIQEVMSEDLKLTDWQRKIFWEMFRNGMLHQALPKDGNTKYHFHHSFNAYPVFEVYENGITYIQIDPIKFTERVINEFVKQPELFDLSDSYPLPIIIPEE